jgi:hypothetical protein
VAELVDRIEGEGFPVMARLTFAVVRKFCGWCIEKGHRDDNPCDGMKGSASPRPRDRVIDDDEVRLFWQATAALGAPFAQALRFRLLTAARRDKVGGIVCSELDREKKLWRLPADRAKNDSGHEIDLAPLARAEIDRLDEDTARHLRDQAERDRRGEPLTDAERRRSARWTLAPFVFGARGTTPLSGWSNAKRRLDDQMTRIRRDEAEPKRAGEPLSDADRKNLRAGAVAHARTTAHRRDGDVRRGLRPRDGGARAQSCVGGTERPRRRPPAARIPRPAVGRVAGVGEARRVACRRRRG